MFEEGKKKAVYEELGEMLFTHFGISGPLVLSASAHLRYMDKKKYFAEIDLKPALSVEKLNERILRDFAKYSNKDYINSLSELLPRKMVPVIVKLSKIEPSQKVNQITKEQREALVTLLKSLTLTVTGFRPIEEAIVTKGGVNLKEILPIEDTLIDIDNKSLTNRPDMWGHYGIAREIAAITGRTLKFIPMLKII